MLSMSSKTSELRVSKVEQKESLCSGTKLIMFANFAICFCCVSARGLSEI